MIPVSIDSEKFTENLKVQESRADGKVNSLNRSHLSKVQLK